MPYIAKRRRDDFYCTGDCERQDPSTVGELTYVLTLAATTYLESSCENYADHAEVLAALEAAKLEFYRRIVAPYEDKKCAENGDVYSNDDN